MADLKKQIKELIKELQELGWRVELRKKHYFAFPPNPEQSIAHFACSPSDWRALKNVRAEIKRSLRQTNL